MGSKVGDFEFERKEAGRIGERIAAEFLERRGFKVIKRNYRKPWGEIDIIAELNNTVRFVEVKTMTNRTSNVSRESFDHYRPEEQAHSWKMRKVARTADMYMNSNRDEREYQIDVIAVRLDKKTRTARCSLYEQVL